MKRAALLWVFAASGAIARAETLLPEGAQPELAVIEQAEALKPWTRALQALKAGERAHVSVCHFGDSHLQSGQVDKVLRQAYQERFGDAGRGYVFPYAALGTASPPDTGSAADAEWRLRRMMGESAGGPVGPGGLAALCEQPNFVLALDTRALDPPSTFDQVRVLYAPGADHSEIWVATRPQAQPYVSKLERDVWREKRVREGDTLESIADENRCSVADLKRWNGPGYKLRLGRSIRLWRAPSPDLPRLQGFTVWGVLSGQDARAWNGMTVDLGRKVEHVFLLGAQSAPEQKRTELLGLVLQHQDGKGLFWHSLAANGAQARHFSAQAHLPGQVQALAPDLLISSLGTNETQQPVYDLSAAIEEQRHFWRVLRSAAPKAALLVVTPPDAKWGRHASRRLNGFVNALRVAALEEGAAFLDLRAAQGGKGAYDRWAEAGLAGKDGVHYKNAGYRLWGQWMLDAMRRAEAGDAP